MVTQLWADNLLYFLWAGEYTVVNRRDLVHILAFYKGDKHEETNYTINY